MTEQIITLNQMIDLGELIESEVPDFLIQAARSKMADLIPTHFDNWEVCITMHCINSLVDHVNANDGDFPKSIGIPDESMGEQHPMHKYMDIAWKTVTFEYLGDEIPMKYEVVT